MAEEGKFTFQQLCLSFEKAANYGLMTCHRELVPAFGFFPAGTRQQADFLKGITYPRLLGAASVEKALQAIEHWYEIGNTTFGLDLGFNVEDHDRNEERKVKTLELETKFISWKREDLFIRTNISKNAKIRRVPGGPRRQDAVNELLVDFDTLAGIAAKYGNAIESLKNLYRLELTACREGVYSSGLGNHTPGALEEIHEQEKHHTDLLCFLEKVRREEQLFRAPGSALVTVPDRKRAAPQTPNADPQVQVKRQTAAEALKRAPEPTPAEAAANRAIFVPKRNTASAAGGKQKYDPHYVSPNYRGEHPRLGYKFDKVEAKRKEEYPDERRRSPSRVSGGNREQQGSRRDHTPEGERHERRDRQRQGRRGDEEQRHGRQDRSKSRERLEREVATLRRQLGEGTSGQD